jgi:hypothetical protein
VTRFLPLLLQDALNYAIMSRPTETPPRDPVSVFHEYLVKACQQAGGASDVCLEAVPLEAERNEKHLPPPEVALQVITSSTTLEISRDTCRTALHYGISFT